MYSWHLSTNKHLTSETTLFISFECTYIAKNDARTFQCQHKACFDVFVTVSEIFLIIRKIQRGIIINVLTPSCKIPVNLFKSWWTSYFLDRFSKNTLNALLTKFLPMGTELFHIGRQTDMAKLLVAFRCFSTMPKNYLGHSSTWQRIETGTFLTRVWSTAAKRSWRLSFVKG